ncbi:MAG: UDP-N-acetylmuramoyl-L-alanine--D-glutamate ligase [Pseudomonadales bacterium]
MMNAIPQKTAVVGFGVTGQAAARFVSATGGTPVIIDTRPQPQVELPAGAQCFFEQRSWPDIQVAEGILSPGLSLDSCLVRGARAAGVKLISDIDVFFRHVEAPVVGITGTNGKSTVTSWVAHCLGRAGLNAPAGANLGEASLDLALQAADVYVLELSSFQLERSQHHNFRVATVLNVSSDHLDQHGDMAAYAAAKQRITRAAEIVVVNRDDAASAPPEHSGRLVSFGTQPPVGDDDWGIVVDDDIRYLYRGAERVLAVSDLSLSGEHNVDNALATAAIASQFISLELIALGLNSFSGLPHRFEQVATHAGVTYINDSKATNVGATVAALSGFERDGRVILLAGGDAKGADLGELQDALRGRIKCIVALGKDAPAFVQLAADLGLPCERVDSLQQAVARAVNTATEGDTVLLSPACASLDMFANYMQRGLEFRDAVLAHIEGERL